MDWSNILIDAQPWQWIVVAVLVAGLTFALYGWGKERPSPVWLLSSLRLVTLSLIGFLLLSPMLRSTKETRETPVVPTLIDATTSQWMGADSAQRRLALDQWVTNSENWSDGQPWSLERFAFDRTSRNLDDEGWNPRGKRTDLGSAFETIRDRYLHRNVPAVLVVTDGRINRGPDPEYAAEKLDVPHFFIGTGDTSLVTDCEISNLRLNDVAYLGNSFPVEITAQARGARGIPLTIQVKSSDQILGQKTWTPSNDMSSTRFALEVNAEQAGPMLLKATIMSSKDLQEVTQVNNTKQATIEILESRRRVLIVARAPHPDVAALRMAIETNRHQEAAVQWMEDLQSGTSVVEHDVLILHHVEPNDLTGALSEAFQKAKAIWICGQATSRWDNWEVEVVGLQLAPEALITESQARLSNRFEPFPLPKNLKAMAALWPPLACPTGTYTLTSSLQPALLQQVGPVATEWPLWAVREAQESRIALTFGEGFWRWRMQDIQRNGEDASAFDALVHRTIQYISSRNDVRRLRVAGPDRLDEDLRCKFVAEVYDDALSPTTDVDVNMALTRRGQTAMNHRFVPNPDGVDLALDLGHLLPGIYDWTVECVQNGERLSQRGTTVIQAVQAEASLTPANHKLLQRLAKQSGGAFLGTLDEPSDMAKLRARWAEETAQLSAQDIVHTSSERMPLHDQTFLLVALLASLAIEWALRRAGGGR